MVCSSPSPDVPRHRSRLGPRRGLAAALPVALVFASAAPAHAQLTADQALRVADTRKSSLPPDALGGELGFGGLSEDFFVTLALRMNFDRENWGIGLQLPLRIRLIDRAPSNDADFGGLLRREDWDQLQDYLRVIRYVYVGRFDKKGPFYLRLGELSNLTIGYGTVVHRYFNQLDVNLWRTGLNAAVNVGPFGGEAVIGDVANPYFAGVRLHARPLQLVLGEESFWKRLVVGASVFADARAPFELAAQTDPAAGAVGVQVKDGVPVVTRERAFFVSGVDVGLELLDTELFDITPYTALNKMNVVDQGWGWHTGVLWSLRVPLVLDTLVADLRTEYRRVSGDYLGPYFNTVYEVERYQRLDLGDGASTAPKLRSLCFADPTCSGSVPAGKNGLFFELMAGLPQWAFVTGEYVDYDGGQADGSLRLSLEVPALEVVRFSAFYYRINVNGLGDLFKVDDKSAIVAQAQIPFYSAFSLNLRWWRVWQAQPEAGGYASIDDWSVGVGFNLKL
jgi:hypothetical protein